jgi:hypothetical protein
MASESETKTNENIEQRATGTAQKSNKIIFWILGGCLVLFIIGGGIVVVFSYWGYKKVQNGIKAKNNAMLERQRKIPEQKKPENTSVNIPEEPAVEQFDVNSSAGSEGATQYFGEKQIGYIKNVYAKSGKNYLVIDYVQWLTGDAAEKSMREDGQCPKAGECIVYDDYYIRNQNPLIRTFEIAPDVKIVMQTYDAEKTGIVMNNREISSNQFKNIFSSKEWSHLKDVPYIVEISNQQIVKITEQYIP